MKKFVIVTDSCADLNGELRKKYDIEYNKLHKKQFKVNLNIEEYNLLCELLKLKNLSKVQFVRNAFEELKKK